MFVKLELNILQYDVNTVVSVLDLKFVWTVNIKVDSDSELSCDCGLGLEEVCKWKIEDLLSLCVCREQLKAAQTVLSKHTKRRTHRALIPFSWWGFLSWWESSGPTAGQKGQLQRQWPDTVGPQSFLSLALVKHSSPATAVLQRDRG